MPAVGEVPRPLKGHEHIARQQRVVDRVHRQFVDRLGLKTIGVGDAVDDGEIGAALLDAVALLGGEGRHLGGIDGFLRETGYHHRHRGRPAAVMADVICAVKLLRPFGIALVEVDHHVGAAGQKGSAVHRSQFSEGGIAKRLIVGDRRVTGCLRVGLGEFFLPDGQGRELLGGVVKPVCGGPNAASHRRCDLGEQLRREKIADGQLHAADTQYGEQGKQEDHASFMAGGFLIFHGFYPLKSV